MVEDRFSRCNDKQGPENNRGRDALEKNYDCLRTSACAAKNLVQWIQAHIKMADSI